MKSMVSKIFVGVDISKDFLDIHLYPLEKNFRMNNSQKGISNFVSMLGNHEVFQIACESSGGYEYLMLEELTKNNYKVWQINPRRVRAFITSEGIKAKTDKIDARMIALFASQKQPSYEQVNRPETEARLKALVRCRADFVKEIVRENNKVQHPQQVHCKEIISKHITFMEEQIRELEKEIDKLMEIDGDLKNKAKFIRSIPGLGRITAYTLIAEVPELGKVGNKRIAALLGVAPFIKQSGKSKGTAAISGGRSEVRRVIYMAAVAASRYNPVFKLFYKKLCDKGKKPKVALVAIMRKLIVTLNVMVKNEKEWKFA
jgi:transposase